MPPLNTTRKIFVSYKYKDWNVQALPEFTPTEDTGYLYTPRHYVDKLISLIGNDHIYKGELSGEDASHLSDDTIDSNLKSKIFDSSVTVVFISPNMYDRSLLEKDQWIPNEIAYSMRNKTRAGRTSNTNGMLAVVLPDVNGSYNYAVQEKTCGVRTWQTHSFFNLLKANMFNKKNKNQQFCNSCFLHHHFGDDHSYIHPVIWDHFLLNHNAYIGHAAALRDRLNEFDITCTHQ